MSKPTFAIAPVTSKGDYDALLNLVCEYYAAIPEDAFILQNTIIAMKKNVQSLMGVGRLNDDPCSFFILGLDQAPFLDVIYVPPGLRNRSLGSALFTALATMMEVADIPRLSITASGGSIRFFERLGARVVAPAQPGTGGECGLVFSARELKWPSNLAERVS